MPVGPETGPGVIDRVDLTPERPSPEECLPPGEEPLVDVDLSPGWIAVSERELLTYHPDRTPAVERADRPNVTALSVRRAGARAVIAYVPFGVVAAIASLLVGGVLLVVDPMGYVQLPDAPGVDPVVTVLRTFAQAIQLLGMVLVFAGVLVLLSAAAAAAYWLASRRVTLRIERDGAEPIECPTTRSEGRRAVRTLREALGEE